MYPFPTRDDFKHNYTWQFYTDSPQFMTAVEPKISVVHSKKNVRNVWTS